MADCRAKAAGKAKAKPAGGVARRHRYARDARALDEHLGSLKYDIGNESLYDWKDEEDDGN